MQTCIWFEHLFPHSFDFAYTCLFHKFAEERPAFLMSPPCLESQGCLFDPTFLHPLSCSSDETYRSFCLILFCFWLILLISFSLNLDFLKTIGSFVWLLLLWCFSERLGNEYFSWSYVQHMLPYMARVL